MLQITPPLFCPRFIDTPVVPLPQVLTWLSDHCYLISINPDQGVVLSFCSCDDAQHLTESKLTNMTRFTSNDRRPAVQNLFFNKTIVSLWMLAAALLANTAYATGKNNWNRVAGDSASQAGTASIQLNSNGKCINSMLTLSGITADVSKIEWKKDGKSMETYNMPSPISTIAGGSIGEDASRLKYPLGICADADNNIYIADQYNHRIQKWAPGALEGVTVAGGMGQGNADDQLNYPYSVTVDKTGNLYIADAGNHRIQKWAPGAARGITVAGGNGKGTAANQLSFPYGLALDKDNSIYISDYYNHRIQKWMQGANEGITVAGGNGAGDKDDQLQYPNGVFVDNDNNIYIADSRNDRIQYWTPGAKKGITVAGGNGRGNKYNQLYYPTTIYVSEQKVLYIADRCNHRIVKWEMGAAYGSAVAGAGNADDRFVYPYSVCFDTGGNMYVSDEQNSRVRKYKAASRQATAYNLPAGEPGNYFVDILFRDSSTVTTDMVSIASLPVLSAISGADTVCVASSAVFQNTVLNGIWSSEDAAVATIDENGLVNAKTIGNTRINYTITNEQGCSASVAMLLTVSGNIPEPVISGSDTLTENTKGVLMSSMPDGRWISSDESIVKIDQFGEITALLPGTGTIIYEVSNTKGCSAMTQKGIIVKAKVKSADEGYTIRLGESRKPIVMPAPAPIQYKTVTQNVSKTTQEFRVIVLGNPVTAFFLLRIQGNEKEPVLLRVADMAGRIIESQKTMAANNTIQLGNSYARGTYVAELVQGQQRQVLQLVKL